MEIWYKHVRKSLEIQTSGPQLLQFSLIEKCLVNLKNILQRCIFNQEFNEDLVYEFKKIVSKPYFSDMFRNDVKRFQR